MRKIFLPVLLLFSLLFFLCGAAAENVAVPPPETPVPVRIHNAPEPTETPPAVINRQLTPDPLEDIRFRVDAQFLEIWFPNIMNADEAIILYGDTVWLIDCGDVKSNGGQSGLRGVELMKKLGITKIDKLFNTHPHHDHLGGLQVTHESIPVSQLLICFPEDVNDTMVQAIAYAEQASIPVQYFTDGSSFSMGNGEVYLQFYCNEDETLDMNNNSAQALLQYGSRRMLFMADMDRPGQAAMLKERSAEELRAEIIKYPHHGKNGLLEEFYQAVSPSVAVITNTYVQWNGIEYMIWKQLPRFYTNPTEKYVHLYTDGNVWVIEYVPMNEV